MGRSVAHGALLGGPFSDALSAYVYDEVGATGTAIKVSDTSGTLLASREDEAAGNLGYL